jgi:hypothetical protein
MHVYNDSRCRLIQHDLPDNIVSMPALTLPPFPNDIPTVGLLVIDYELIKNGDQNEINRLWEAATKLGFW